MTESAACSEDVLESLMRFVRSHGIEVGFVDDVPTSTGRFHGTSIVLNRLYETLTQAFTLAHTFGHCVQWAVDFDGCAGLYAAVARARAAGGEGLDDALRAFSRYETEATAYGLGALAATGNESIGAAFCLYSAADIEAVLIYHRTGTAPPWSEFFPEWLRRLTDSGAPFPEFPSKPIPPFRPVLVPERNVIRSVETA